jgi:hypothetical protein
MVMQDLRRTPLELNDVDVVIFDLIDERFNIHHVDGQLLTASKQFLDAGGQAALNSEIAFPMGSEEHYRSFQRGCEYMQDHPHRILKPSDSLVVGDEAHRWGKASFHYVPEYYDEIWSQITQSSA